MKIFYLMKINKKLNRVLFELDKIQRGQKKMSAELEVLKAEVTETLGVAQSAVALIEGLAAKLAEIADDPAAILALAAELDGSANALAAAIAANPVP
jgi:hypothetical protein